MPFYAASLSAAIAVELALRDRGWWRTGPRHRDAPADERVVLAHADGRTVEAVGPLNEALCSGRRSRRWNHNGGRGRRIGPPNVYFFPPSLLTRSLGSTSEGRVTMRALWAAGLVATALGSRLSAQAAVKISFSFDADLRPATTRKRAIWRSRDSSCRTVNGGWL